MIVIIQTKSNQLTSRIFCIYLFIMSFACAVIFINLSSSVNRKTSIEKKYYRLIYLDLFALFAYHSISMAKKSEERP